MTQLRARAVAEFFILSLPIYATEYIVLFDLVELTAYNMNVGSDRKHQHVRCLQKVHSDGKACR